MPGLERKISANRSQTNVKHMRLDLDFRVMHFEQDTELAYIRKLYTVDVRIYIYPLIYKSIYIYIYMCILLYIYISLVLNV